MKPFIYFIAVAFAFYCTWRLIKKTGHSGVMAVLFFIPIGNIFAWVYLVFVEWPVEVELKRYRKLHGTLLEEVNSGPDLMESDSECVECRTLIPAGKAVCPSCGWSYKKELRKIKST